MRDHLKQLMKSILRSPWVVWLILSAVLFLCGSAIFEGGGVHGMAQVGVLGAIAAVAVIAAFAG